MCLGREINFVQADRKGLLRVSQVALLQRLGKDGEPRPERARLLPRAAEDAPGTGRGGVHKTLRRQRRARDIAAKVAAKNQSAR